MKTMIYPSDVRDWIDDSVKKLDEIDTEYGVGSQMEDVISSLNDIKGDLSRIAPVETLSGREKYSLEDELKCEAIMKGFNQKSLEEIEAFFNS